MAQSTIVSTRTILRPFQVEALQALEQHQHVLCVAPTGSGKSLIYETWIQRNRPRTILLTPLVSLARQQRERLREQSDRVRVLCPESLLNPKCEQNLLEWNPQFWVVDECHCIWEWGREFRPAYAQVPAWMKKTKPSHSLWLTATLPGIARKELREALQPAQLHELGGFKLPENLMIRCFYLDYIDRLQALKTWILMQREPGLIFVNTRRWAEKLSRWLKEQVGAEAEFYHAGLSQEEKISVENQLRAKKLQTVIATSAFGMGMDFPFLKWVVIWQPPYSLLALAQALGRVARNESKGTALLFWSHMDFRNEHKTRENADVLEWYVSSNNRKVALYEYFE